MTKMKDIRCRKCGKNAMEISGYLGRVNPKGEVPIVMECKPSCDAKMTKEEALIAAISGDLEDQGLKP